MIVKLIIKISNRPPIMRFKGFLICLFAINWPCYQIIAADLPIGARALGMGSTYVALVNTADALFLNPAGLSQIQGTEASFFYQKPFGLDDLNFATAVISFPVRKTRMNFGYALFGNGLYTEQHLKIAYSQNYAKKIFYGIGLDFQSIQIEGSGSARAFLIDLGLVVPITQELRLGFAAKNVSRSKIGRSKEALPQSFNTGLSLQPHPSLILNIDIFKDVHFEQELRFGIEIKAHDNLVLRSGTANYPNRFSAGFGLSIDRFVVDYAFFTHNDLGLTHQMSFSIKFGVEAETVEPDVKPVIADLGKSTENQNRTITKAPININNASADELQNLPGIGPKLAKAIISYREAEGPFLQIEDLKKVDGIGTKTLEKMRPYIIVQDMSIK